MVQVIAERVNRTRPAKKNEKTKKNQDEKHKKNPESNKKRKMKTVIRRSVCTACSAPACCQSSDKGLMLETSAFRISVRSPIYIIDSVDKTKFLYSLEASLNT